MVILTSLPQTVADSSIAVSTGCTSL